MHSTVQTFFYFDFSREKMFDEFDGEEKKNEVVSFEMRKNKKFRLFLTNF